jgi:hypothetical protein
MSKRRAHYCVRIANSICEKIALGNSLRDALEIVGPLAPSMPTFWRWLDEYPEFRVKYERARQMQGDVLADEILDMAKIVVQKPSLAAAIRVASDILMWQAGIRDVKYNSKVAPEEKRKLLPADELRKEIGRLELELGVKATPGMNTAPNYAKQKPMPDIEAAEMVEPAPPPKRDEESTEFRQQPEADEINELAVNDQINWSSNGC